MSLFLLFVEFYRRTFWQRQCWCITCPSMNNRWFCSTTWRTSSPKNEFKMKFVKSEKYSTDQRTRMIYRSLAHHKRKLTYDEQNPSWPMENIQLNHWSDEVSFFSSIVFTYQSSILHQVIRISHKHIHLPKRKTKFIELNRSNERTRTNLCCVVAVHCDIDGKKVIVATGWICR